MQKKHQVVIQKPFQRERSTCKPMKASGSSANSKRNFIYFSLLSFSSTASSWSWPLSVPRMTSLVEAVFRDIKSNKSTYFYYNKYVQISIKAYQTSSPSVICCLFQATVLTTRPFNLLKTRGLLHFAWV